MWFRGLLCALSVLLLTSQGSGQAYVRPIIVDYKLVNQPAPVPAPAAPAAAPKPAPAPAAANPAQPTAAAQKVAQANGAEADRQAAELKREAAMAAIHKAEGSRAAAGAERDTKHKAWQFQLSEANTKQSKAAQVEKQRKDKEEKQAKRDSQERSKKGAEFTHKRAASAAALKKDIAKQKYHEAKSKELQESLANELKKKAKLGDMETTVGALHHLENKLRSAYHKVIAKVEKSKEAFDKARLAREKLRKARRKKRQDKYNAEEKKQKAADKAQLKKAWAVEQSMKDEASRKRHMAVRMRKSTVRENLSKSHKVNDREKTMKRAGSRESRAKARKNARWEKHAKKEAMQKASIARSEKLKYVAGIRQLTKLQNRQARSWTKKEANEFAVKQNSFAKFDKKLRSTQASEVTAKTNMSKAKQKLSATRAVKAYKSAARKEVEEKRKAKANFERVSKSEKTNKAKQNAEQKQSLDRLKTAERRDKHSARVAARKVRKAMLARQRRNRIKHEKMEKAAKDSIRQSIAHKKAKQEAVMAKKKAFYKLKEVEQKAHAAKLDRKNKAAVAAHKAREDKLKVLKKELKATAATHKRTLKALATKLDFLKKEAARAKAQAKHRAAVEKASAAKQKSHYLKMVQQYHEKKAKAKSRFAKLRLRMKLHQARVNKSLARWRSKKNKERAWKQSWRKRVKAKHSKVLAVEKAKFHSKLAAELKVKNSQRDALKARLIKEKASAITTHAVLESDWSTRKQTRKVMFGAYRRRVKELRALQSTEMKAERTSKAADRARLNANRAKFFRIKARLRRTWVRMQKRLRRKRTAWLKKAHLRAQQRKISEMRLKWKKKRVLENQRKTLKQAHQKMKCLQSTASRKVCKYNAAKEAETKSRATIHLEKAQKQAIRNVVHTQRLIARLDSKKHRQARWKRLQSRTAAQIKAFAAHEQRKLSKESSRKAKKQAVTEVKAKARVQHFTNRWAKRRISEGKRKSYISARFKKSSHSHIKALQVPEAAYKTKRTAELAKTDADRVLLYSAGQNNYVKYEHKVKAVRRKYVVARSANRVTLQTAKKTEKLSRSHTPIVMESIHDKKAAAHRRFEAKRRRYARAYRKRLRLAALHYMARVHRIRLDTRSKARSHRLVYARAFAALQAKLKKEVDRVKAKIASATKQDKAQVKSFALQIAKASAGARSKLRAAAKAAHKASTDKIRKYRAEIQRLETVNTRKVRDAQKTRGLQRTLAYSTARKLKLKALTKYHRYKAVALHLYNKAVHGDRNKLSHRLIQLKHRISNRLKKALHAQTVLFTAHLAAHDKRVALRKTYTQNVLKAMNERAAALKKQFEASDKLLKAHYKRWHEETLALHKAKTAVYANLVKTAKDKTAAKLQQANEAKYKAHALAKQKHWFNSTSTAHKTHHAAILVKEKASKSAFAARSKKQQKRLQTSFARRMCRKRLAATNRAHQEALERIKDTARDDHKRFVARFRRTAHRLRKHRRRSRAFFARQRLNVARAARARVNRYARYVQLAKIADDKKILHLKSASMRKTMKDTYAKQDLNRRKKLAALRKSVARKTQRRFRGIAHRSLTERKAKHALKKKLRAHLLKNLHKSKKKRNHALKCERKEHAVKVAKVHAWCAKVKVHHAKPRFEAVAPVSTPEQAPTAEPAMELRDEEPLSADETKQASQLLDMM